VEEAIDEHYARQIAALGEDEAELSATIADCRRDEIAHRDAAIAHGAEDAPGYRVLSAAIKAGCRAAIWLSERL
jgi:ubiquinone biosynthesis monooxygenase Coq7